MTREFKLNSEMTWVLWLDEHSEPPINTPIWLLCEADTCDPTMYPAMFKVIIEEYDDPNKYSLRAERTGKGWKYRLLEFNPETEDEFLSPNHWEFKAWREMTDHAGTWDKYLADEESAMGD